MKTILEGLTGTGKSQTLAALRRLGLAPAFVVEEEETYGDFMTELSLGTHSPAFLVRRLERVLHRLRTEAPPTFLLERFHVSYYALASDWTRYDDIDRALADLGVSIVLLAVDEAALRHRSLHRAEYGGADWQDFARYYGSEDAALTALRDSQRRRFDALLRTRLPHRTIDTTAGAWDDYARLIATET